MYEKIAGTLQIYIIFNNEIKINNKCIIAN